MLGADSRRNAEINRVMYLTMRFVVPSKGAKGLFGVTKTDTSFSFFELLTARGLDYRFAEAPADDYYALLAICKAPAFDGRRDAWEMRS